MPATDKAPTPKQVIDWSRDGRYVVFEESNPDTSWDLKYIDTREQHRVGVAVRTPFLERLGQLSPDGRLIAYESDETGQLEIFVATFPDASSRWPISNCGGSKPRWNPNGSELLFVDSQGILQSVAITTSGGSGRPGRRRSSSSARVLVMRISAKATPPALKVLMNWRPD